MENEQEHNVEVLQPQQLFSDARLRATAAQFMLGLFAFCVVATFALIFCEGLGFIKLEGWLLKTIVGATIGEVATILGYIIRYLFKAKG